MSVKDSIYLKIQSDEYIGLKNLKIREYIYLS